MSRNSQRPAQWHFSYEVQVYNLRETFEESLLPSFITVYYLSSSGIKFNGTTKSEATRFSRAYRNTSHVLL
jgi:hypothetical protein